MKMDTCIEVAARIWCDKELHHVALDPDATMNIAKILFFAANADERRKENALLENQSEIS